MKAPEVSGGPRPVDRLRLVAGIISRLSGELGQPPRSLLELEGLGHEVWQSVDVEDYCAGNAPRGMDRPGSGDDRRAGHCPAYILVERTGRHDLAREFRDIPVRSGV